MKFLVPTDFSKNADHAIEYAAGLAKALSASLVLVHVNIPTVTLGNIAAALFAEEEDSITMEDKARLNEISSRLLEQHNVGCKIAVRMGNPVEEITNEAEANAVDVIIMGTAGASGISKFLFGSNTVSVIERSTCPVLAVPADAAITIPRKIVFATDYRDSDMEAINGIVKLTGMLQPELTVLHVSKEVLASERDLIEQFSKAVTNELHIPTPYYYVMPHGNILEGIDLFIRSAEADLIVLSRRKRGFIEKLFEPSLTKKIAYLAKFPLLVFQPTNRDESI